MLSQRKHYNFSIALFFVLIIFLSNTPTGRASSIRYVSAGSPTTNDCLTAATACGSIQSAIGKASPGDTILISVGEYSGEDGKLLTIDRNVTLSGGWDIQFTSQTGHSTLNGQGMKDGVAIEINVTAVIDHAIIQDYYNDAGPLFGSAIKNLGTLTMMNSIVRNNANHGTGGGIENRGTLTIEDSEIIGNRSYEEGGGIINYGSLSLNHTTLMRNNSHDGGAIANYGQLTLVDSMIAENASRSTGGGIYNVRASLEVIHSTFRGNSSETGAGALSASQTKVTIRDSFFIGNHVTGNGGAITCSSQSEVNVMNSTFTGNGNSANHGGAIYAGCTLYLINSTVVLNKANNSGGIEITSSGHGTIKHTILADNTGGYTPNCSGPVDTLGYNLVDYPSGCNFDPSKGDLLGVKPNLISRTDLFDFLMLPLESPAVNGGDPSGCKDEAGNPILTDQRGAPRQGACDIGAWEWNTPGEPDVLRVLTGTPQTANIGTAFFQPFKVMALDQYETPLNGTSIIFQSPESGPSGTFIQDQKIITVATDELGIAAAPAFTANQIVGSYTVTALTGAAPVTASFNLENISRLFFPAVSCLQCSNEITEDFSSPYSGWYSGQDQSFLAEYSKGEYHIQTSAPEMLYMVVAPVCLHKYFSLEVDAHWGRRRGLTYGLIFSANADLSNFYLFDLSPDYQAYRLFRIEGDSVVPKWGGPVPSEAILAGGGTNHLEINRSRYEIDITINGVNVADSWDGGEGINFGYVGLAVTTASDNGIADAFFDNFEVKDIPGPISQQAAQPYDWSSAAVRPTPSIGTRILQDLEPFSWLGDQPGRK
jgi:hypothetical protein